MTLKKGMGKSLVSNSRYCFSIPTMIAWECISQDSLDQGFWLGAVFDMELDKLVKLLG